MTDKNKWQMSQPMRQSRWTFGKEPEGLLSIQAVVVPVKLTIFFFAITGAPASLFRETSC